MSSSPAKTELSARHSLILAAIIKRAEISLSTAQWDDIAAEIGSASGASVSVIFLLSLNFVFHLQFQC